MTTFSNSPLQFSMNIHHDSYQVLTVSGRTQYGLVPGLVLTFFPIFHSAFFLKSLHSTLIRIPFRGFSPDHFKGSSRYSKSFFQRFHLGILQWFLTKWLKDFTPGFQRFLAGFLLGFPPAFLSNPFRDSSIDPFLFLFGVCLWILFGFFSVLFPRFHQRFLLDSSWVFFWIYTKISCRLPSFKNSDWLIPPRVSL